MKKMKTVWALSREKPRLATEIVQVPWVIEGEGVATIKYDGTACLIEGGRLYRRYEAKKGRTVPEGWVPCEPGPDPVTGHWPGWQPVDAADPACRWHLEAFHDGLEDGTYELVGPKVQSGRYGLDRHELWRHGRETVEVERTREAIFQWLSTHTHEGLVFHHPDGRMAKIRRKDFGLRW